METNQTMGMASATKAKCKARGAKIMPPPSPEWMLLQIELLVISSAFLLLFLVIFGSCRRCCNSDKLRLVIFAAYSLSNYILTFSLGLMHNIPFHNPLFPIWAMLLMIALGSADSLSAYSLEDNEKWKSYNWQLGIKSIWLGLLIGLSNGDLSHKTILFACLFFIWALKCDERARALMAASRHSLERSTKVIADYMSREHENGGEVDPVSMRGYRYLVRGEEERWANNLVPKRFIKWCLGRKKPALAPDYRTPLENEDELITVEKVWKCEGRLLSQGGDPHNKLKDICLSFALFKLLRLRYAGYSLPQEAYKKTWNLIHHGLLSEQDGYKRAFQVVEVELTFLFDFLYTKYNIIFQPGRLLLKLVELMYVAVAIWYTTSILKNYKKHCDIDKPVTVLHGVTLDILMTNVMIISFIVVELMQLFFIWFSQWAKVVWICQYVQKKSWQENVWIERMIRVICWVRLLKPWEQKLRQYSLLEQYSYKPFSLLNNKLMAVYIDQTRDGQRQSTPIKLPEEVKQAVFHALKSHDGIKLENGQASLRGGNESKELLWACQLETQTQVIMVWHIATSFCEHQLPERSNSPETRRNLLLATSLSKYLAYLVAFAPQLLPDHPCVAEHVFDQAIIEAKDFFGRCNKKDWIREMERKGRAISTHEETIVNRGARLRNQLTNDIKHEDEIWRILADFWVELVLYVAPSDDMKAHAEHLTRGGEFVTHLWALLSHARIERSSY
ncbi:hypothetical protein ACJRO7_017567 [Eucalyptus globulus]|uniref:DUF4220 domain-containing protein n=1 Tax=Eucalyptus globulus TaxID=34317 RepID=A0ABD3KXM3_EUCGL